MAYFRQVPLAFLLTISLISMTSATGDIPVDCSAAELAVSSEETSSYSAIVVHPSGGQPFNALCRVDDDGSKWTVILNNVGGGDWDLKKDDYAAGFGNLDITTNFMLGLERINEIVSQPECKYELRVDLTATAPADAEADAESGEDTTTETYARYVSFYISKEASGFYLSYGQYDTESTAENGLSTTSLNRRFSATDDDNDGSSTINCADFNRAGWWYQGTDCATSILTKATPLWNSVEYSKATMRIKAV